MKNSKFWELIRVIFTPHHIYGKPRFKRHIRADVVRGKESPFYTISCGRKKYFTTIEKTLSKGLFYAEFSSYPQFIFSSSFL